MNCKVYLSVTTFNLLAPCYRKIQVSEGSSHAQNERQPPERTVCTAENENFTCKNGECLSNSPKVSNYRSPKCRNENDHALVSCSTWKKWSQFFFESIQKYRERLDSEMLESQVKERWKTRARKLVNFLKEQLETDVICLQEYWCTQPEWCSIFQDNFSRDYDIYTAKRSGEKADGLVTLVRRNSCWKVIDTEKYYFRDCGERLLLATVLRLKDDDMEQTKGDTFDCLLINTHLSFPHGSWGRSLRLIEVKRLLEFIDSFLELHPGQVKAVVVVGDFNSTLEDVVCQQVVSRGFANSYYLVHGNENVVTHCNHKGQSLAVDKVYFKQIAAPSQNVTECKLKKSSSEKDLTTETSHITCSLSEGIKFRMTPIEATVFPPSLDAEQWPTASEYNLSDHRPLKVLFEIEIQDT